MAIQKDFIIKNGLEVKSNLIVADSTVERVGIGTSVMNNKLQVLGGIGATNIAVTGIGTIPTLRSTNAYIDTTYSNAGIITSLSGIGATYSIANFEIVGVNTLNAVSGIVTTLSGSNAYYTNTFVTNEYVSNIFGVSGIVTTLNGTTVRYDTANIENGNIVSGVVTTITGTNLNYSGIGTITTAKATTLLANTGNIVSGVVTTITGTNLNYSGIGTIATSKATTLLATDAYVNSGVVTTITGTNLNYSGIGTIGTANIENGNIVSGVVTTITGTNLNYSGIGTIATSKATTLLATDAYVNSGVVTTITGTNLNYSGIGTIATSKATTLLANTGNIVSGVVTTITGTNLNYSGIGTIGGVKIQTGIITSSNSGVVTYYGDGRYLQNIVSGVGISTELGFVGFGATILNFGGSGITTVTVSNGIGTIFFEGFVPETVVGVVTGYGLDIVGVSTLTANSDSPALDITQTGRGLGILVGNERAISVGSATTTGTPRQILQVNGGGGAYVAGDVAIGVTRTNGEKVRIAGGAIITGVTTVSNAASSSGTTTGAFVVTGGVGIGGNMNIGGAVVSSSTVTATQFIRSGGTASQILMADGSVDSFPVSGDWWGDKIPQIGSNGVMEIGRYIDFHSTDATTSDFTFRFDNSSDGNMSFSGSLSVNGNITASGTVTATSDERLKTNIKTIDNALEKVLSIRGVEYDRIDLEEHQIGVIAQEIEKIIPEVVYGDETKSVAYGNLVGLLIEAIKEQQERIEKLERILHNK